MGLRERLAKWLQRRWYARRAPWYLLPLAVLFAAIVAVRRTLYAHGILRGTRVSARVVIVGNITIGGSGKTPLIAWLARKLAAQGLAVGIVTRGYGGDNAHPRLVTLEMSAEEAGDEPLWLARETGVPVAAGRERVAAARCLIERKGCTIILSDDGLQHYRLTRDIEIIAVDGARGFGNGALLPAGPLREPPRRLMRANAIVIKGEAIKGEGAPLSSLDVPVFRMRYALAEAVPLAGGAPVPLAEFRGQAVAALAAIADPESFFRALEAQGLRLVRHPLPDHAPVAETVASLGAARPILMTDKDAAKLAEAPANAFRVPFALAFSETDAARLLALVRGTDSTHSEEEK
jgi:tetraacyldisaccharide 4'-kinase